MLNFKITLIFLTFLLLSFSLRSQDFDMNEYNITMANDALNEGNLEKALELINKADDSPEAEKIKKVILDLKNKNHQIAIQKKREQEKAEKISLENKARNQKIAREKAIKERPERLVRTLCDCHTLKSTYNVSILKENAAAQYSGLVNKEKLYNLGQAMLRIDLKLSKINNELDSLGIEQRNCEDVKGLNGNLCNNYP